MSTHLSLAIIHSCVPRMHCSQPGETLVRSRPWSTPSSDNVFGVVAGARLINPARPALGRTRCEGNAKMTRLYDDPHTFTEDMLAGFLDVHQDAVSGVPGGVVRAAETAPGKVAVVVGGGSGHYPAFCGVVGPGFADGAVVGNIFTSPSAEDAYSVGRAASGGGGVVITSGNYAGDVMNFTQAQQRLN